MKKYKPTTPGRRGMSRSDFSKISDKKPEKNLLKPHKKKGGRGSGGQITVRHKGGGVKRKYRIVDFGQKKKDIRGEVKALEYDPNRTAFLALVEYEDGDKRYILAPHGLNKGDKIICSDGASVKLGNRIRLKNIPVGTPVYNIELEPGTGGKMARGAGASAEVIAHEKKYTQLKMPSTEVRRVNKECFVSIGEVSNPEHRFVNVGKAGRNRLKGKRPTVRGSAMSPVDHPHGGGEGRAEIGLKYQKTPWGKPARGVKTRKKKWTDKLIIKRRKKKK